MPSPIAWQQMKQTGNVPTARSGHTIVTIKKTHYMFGGIDSAKDNPDKSKILPKNQLYVLRITNTPQSPNTAEWTLKPCTGDVPLPRAYHAACVIGEDKMLVFGGYYTSNTRFNDTFYLKTNNFQWFQPPNQKSVGEPKNSWSKIGAPQPRANHTATFHKGKVYIFGGHGGVDYKRTAFNDVYELDVENEFKWEKLAINGNPPEPRGGHTASILANQDKLMVFGGWNFSSQFHNIFILNLETKTWQDPESNHQIPKWNLGGVMAPSIPSWKYFIFGGSVGNFFEGSNRTGTRFVDDSWYLDVDKLTWNPVPLEDKVKPKARQSPGTFYSEDDQRMYIFGGWANNWLSDMWVLPVGAITGPPYAIFEIRPNLGPLTGKTKVTIIGAGFKETYGPITVKFTGGKGSLDVSGTYKSETQIDCQTPSFEQYGPRKVEVRLSFGKHDVTITKTDFIYFLNTKADQTIAYGPGLLHDNAVGVDTMFYIQARNLEGKNRQSGSDEFVITIRRPDLQKAPEQPLDPKKQKEFDELPQQTKQQILNKKAQQQRIRLSKVQLDYTIIDNQDGSYIVKYKADEECKVIVEIFYKNQKGELEKINGHRFEATFSSKASPKNNEFLGPTHMNYLHSHMNDIGKFIETSRQTIDTRNKNINQNVKQLLKVMNSLKEIQEKREDSALTLNRIEQIFKTLDKKYDTKKQNDLKKSQKMEEELRALVQMATRVDKDIVGPKTTQGVKTKENIKKFEESLKEFNQGLKKKAFYEYTTGVQGSFEKMEEVKNQINQFKKTFKDYVYYELMFKFQDNETAGAQKILESIENEVGWMQKLWIHIKQCQQKFDNYLKLKWSDVNTGEIEDEVKKLRQGLQPIKISDRKCGAFVGITQDIKNWSTFIPMVTDLKDPSMEVSDQRHWKKVKSAVNQDFQDLNTLDLNRIWGLKLFDIKDQIEDITQQAKNQAKMEKSLKKIIEFWKNVEFELVPHKTTDIKTLKMLDENFETLQQHQLSINTMLLSKYISYFEKQVEKWKQDLGSIYDIIQLLSQVQKTWSFLQNLFIQSQQVKKQLPHESEQFVGIDRDMKQIMARGCDVKNILNFCTIEGMLKRLQKIQGDLKICEKALNQFLDSKRRAFPRFYFVSVSDLLDILSNGNNPSKINKHMSKIFQAIDKLQLQESSNDRPTAKTMITGVGTEEVKLTTPLKLVGKVEIYLQDMIDSMVNTLRDIADGSFKAIATMERKKWLERDPAQITLLVNNIIWSAKVEKCFRQITDGTNVNALKQFYKESVTGLTQLIEMVQGKLDKPMRQKIMCLITMDTHSRDVVEKLDAENVKKVDAFQWQSQLKFYWEKHGSFDDAIIKIADASIWYSYEYLGNGPRLVVTPLTDRIYVTATQALHLKMGCAPAGPAGTGKTETTKDLANAVAKACYVFNCSSEMNYESMGNIYKGLASSGCWGCFDQFNRLLPQVLSVCSVQFKSVTDAIRQNKKRFVLQGDEISLDPTCGVFITMNPGYLGRAELPQGLKALFRPITVVVPDLELICENMLMAQGFVEAKILAKKFVTLYMLCRDLLSKQLHYDWGLRAIKSVLVVAGGFKRAEPTIAESALLMRALRDFNLPKIAFADLDVFAGLLNDLFPGTNIPRKRDMDFEKIIETVTIQNELYPEPQFILKVVQMSQLLEIRHCVFVMGPPGAGKSSTWKILGKSQDKVGKKTMIVDINPKTVSTRDLYGYNLPSKEWKDGLLSKMMRSLSEMADTNPKWIMLDGDLDANWIESMNSVMDDNKILTLANNERIPLKPHMRMVFEIRDLRFASPATVSRAGILYISDDSGYQWQSYVKSWSNKMIKSGEINEQVRSDLEKLFDKYVKGTLLYIKKNVKLLINVAPISMIISLCRVLQCLLKEGYSNLQYAFVFSLVWSCGGCLAEKDGFDYRKEFSNWWKGEWKTAVKFPSKGTIFDYFVDNPKPDSKDPCKFEEWTKILASIDYDPSKQSMGNVTVPTKETIATQFFIKKYIQVAHPVLMIGLAGCGKTQLAKGILRSIVRDKPENFAYQQINFNYYTDSTYLQIQLEQTLEKKAGKQFGPPGKIKLIYFIDDLNMPQLDQYDTQSAISLLRQHADYEHWYDVSKLTLKDIINTQTLAALNPSAGSFFVDPRYMRHFWTVSIPFPDNQSLFLIYSTFLNGHLKKFKPALQEAAPLIIRSALSLHQTVISSFRKTAINFHYEFNLRHLSNVFQGLLLSDPSRYAEPEKFVKLWIHESERTYGDRLVSSDHLQKYNTAMFDLVKKSFGRFSLSKYFSSNPQNLIFSDFTQGMNGAERLYDLMPNDKLLPHIEQALVSYNDNNPVMNLVLFEDAMKHVCRITRIFMPSSGHALLVGVGGSGKQSLSRLAASIMFMSAFQITISSTYNMTDLKNDLQLLYNKTGVKEQKYMFLFTEGQITNQRFLVYINDLLSSGQIAELYTLEEKEAIINSVRTKVKGEGKQDTRDNCWNWFIDKVKQNLHMSLCFSPVGQSLRRRARQFPALVNSTVIDWFFPWPKDALLNVATRFLEKEDLGDEKVRDGVVSFMPTSFEVVNKLSTKLFEQQRRYVYTTPKSFLELIKLFVNMLSTKRDNLIKNRQRYENGLIKLTETAQQVAIIEEEVKVKKVQAEEKKKEADVFAAKVGIEREKVEVQNKKAEIEASNCAIIKKDVEEKKATTEDRLEAAQPLVQQAELALNSISKKDFEVCKAFASPPAGIPQVFSATIWLLSGFYAQVDSDPKTKKPKAYDWKSAQKMMKNPNVFMNVLVGFKTIVNNNQVPAANVAFVKKQYLSNPIFDPVIMKNKSNAAAGLCNWVINIVKFYDVIQQVGPLRVSLQQSKKQLEDATVKLNEVEQIVRVLNEKLAELNRNFMEAEAAKQAAINQAERCARRLNLAQRLVKALGSQNERWGLSIVSLNEQLKVVVGDVLMASAFVSYAGPFNKKFRDFMIQGEFLKYFKAHNIPMSNNLDPVKLLTDQSVAARWNQQSLPSDKVSIENGTILTNSQRYPLMIDPQLQGITWIKEKEKDNKLKSLRLGSKNINRELEICIENGLSALIENMDESIDAILMPIIARSFIKKGKNKILKFAGKDLTLHNNFRLFLHTKLSNPHYPPEIQAEATLINFTVTQDGLGDQLLYLIVQRERPDLAAKKIELITQQNDFKIKLKELEDELLFKLANAKGDILDDIALIQNLEDSKRISGEIAVKVEIAKTTEAKINQTSQTYRPAASRGALIYFLLSDLAKIHTFYKYSLESFIVVINRAIDQITEGLETGKSKMYPIDEDGNAIMPQEKKVKKQRKSKMSNKPQGVPASQSEIPGEAKEEIPAQEQPNEGEQKKQQEQNQLEEVNQPSSKKIQGEDDNKQNAQNAENEDEIEQPMSPRSLKKRIEQLIESISYCAFQYTRRGLFERHKIIVGTMLTFRILLRKGELKNEEVEHLIICKQDPNPTSLPQSLKNFITENIWANCKGLESIPAFNGLGTSLQADILQWKKWYQQERVQVAELPKAYKQVSEFHRLLLLRAMRPDRVTSALTNYVSKMMGERYVEQPPFSIFETFEETDKRTPLFFVLFPGVDPTPDVEKVAAKYDISIANGKFINISMGQGQEDPAKKALFSCAQKGHWIMLQNLHLMQSWLKGINGLQGFLQQTYQTSHPNFRVFLSSEPPPLPDMQILPESILQSSIKVSNQAPQFLKANLRRAWAHFDQKFLDKCDKKPNQFKACLFALCYFHSLVLGRKKFGSQGWSRIYNFNDGDLTICADVLFNYLTKYDVVPWEDLKYIFGEIMYGGHITDNWDRRTNATYLNVLMKPELMLPNFNLLYHLFKNPDPAKLDYEGYRKYIQEKLPTEVPQMFGMHPNAEIGYLTTMCQTLFDTILSVQGGSGGSGGSKDDIVMATLTNLKTNTPAEHSFLDIVAKIKDKTPFVVVCLQEIERMNVLLGEIKKTLEDLRLGLTGALNITDAMQSLQKSLQYNKVPSSWETVAYPSKKVLSMWFNELIERNNQLIEWSKDLITPKSLCIAYLFNPMSFLTAIMQNTARSKSLPLDNMILLTNVTLLKSVEEVVAPAENGSYIHGLWLQGAAWQLGAPGQEGYLMQQRPKQLHPKMPVINVVAVPLKQKRTLGQYMCPVYYTSLRGATYIFTANLNMESEDSDPSKWILSGTCLLMSED